MILVRRVALAVLGLMGCLWWQVGCQRSEDRPELQQARGSLMINGEPAMGAMVVLHPSDGGSFDSRGSRPKGTVQADGSFELMTYQNGDGAPVGEYDVAVLWLAEPESNDPWDKLNGRLADPKQTDLHLSVREGQTELEPLELTDITIQKRRPPQPTSDPDGLK